MHSVFWTSVLENFGMDLAIRELETRQTYWKSCLVGIDIYERINFNFRFRCQLFISWLEGIPHLRNLSNPRFVELLRGWSVSIPFCRRRNGFRLVCKIICHWISGSPLSNQDIDWKHVLLCLIKTNEVISHILEHFDWVFRPKWRKLAIADFLHFRSRTHAFKLRLLVEITALTFWNETPHVALILINWFL